MSNNRQAKAMQKPCSATKALEFCGQCGKPVGQDRAGRTVAHDHFAERRAICCTFKCANKWLTKAIKERASA